MSATVQPAPAERFARLIASLCAAVAARNIRPGKPGLAGPLIVAIWNRLSRMAQRITRLAARLEAGTLKPPRKRPAGSRRTVAEPKPDGTKLPRGFAWLLPLVPGIVFGRTQLQALLDEPEMQAFIAVAPQIGRTLRPLCHLLGLRPLPPLLRLPPKPPPVHPEPLPSEPPASAQAGRTPPAAPPPARLPRKPRTKPPAPEVAPPAIVPPVLAWVFG